MRGWFDLLDTDGIGASDEPALIESARIAERLIAPGKRRKALDGIESS